MTGRFLHKVKVRRKAPGKVTAIVPAAGSGKRLGMKVRKPFVPIAGVPLIAHTISSLSASDAVSHIIIAAEPSYVGRLKSLVRRYRFNKVSAVVAGGRTRAASVRNCLAKVPDSTDIVIIHDGARPFADSKTIEDSVTLARRHGGCVVAVPESDTVKLTGEDMFIRKTLDRKRIFRAQTPQAFRTSIIKKAYTSKYFTDRTDDSSIVEASGGRVKILVGSYRNIKITTKEDLKFAEVLV